MRFLAGFLLVTGADANVIEWSCPPLMQNLTSTGALMGGDFEFRVGVFTAGFVPTASNMGEWAAHWVTAGSNIYNPASNARNFGGRLTITGNVAPFTVGAEAYVWGRTSGIQQDEWILFRKADWKWPAFSTANPPPMPLDWNTDLVDQVILGTLNVSGSPFLMKSEAVRSYSQWKSTSLAGQPLDSPLDDPDHDGVSNLLEFLFGTSPTQPNGQPATPTSFVEISGQKYLQISIPRLRERLVSVKVEVSSDMVTWQSGASATVELSNTETSLVVRDLTPVVPGLSKRFMRVKAVAQP